MKLRQFFAVVFVVLVGRAGIAAEQSVPQSIILASTTSVENSGLLAHILPAFTKETGITVHVLAQGTGQALQTAARDDADLVLVHDPETEQKFIAAGDGIDRRQIAWNDFIVVGPRSDPAHIAGTHDAVAALKAIASTQAPFVSRGDKSGTDALEHRLWRVAGSMLRKPAADRGTAISAAAWEWRSTPPKPWALTRSVIAALG
jgi:tungstate transport system substrate-binding protein